MLGLTFKLSPHHPREGHHTILFKVSGPGEKDQWILVTVQEAMTIVERHMLGKSLTV